MAMPDDEQKPPLKFIPDGGVAPRRKVKPPAAPHSSTTELFECLVCDTTQRESKSAKFRSIRVRCRHCGRTAYPVEGVVEKVVPVRICKVCGTRLRSTNTTTLCSSCGDR